MNTRTLPLSIAGLALLTASISPAMAQTPAKKAALKKPAAAAAKSAKPSGPIVLGTTQMAGDFGQMGTTYTIGKFEPINFTLKSADYSVDPISIGMNTWVPKADEKLLVLHFTIHNPLPREQSYSWSSVRFTAVDAKDTNHDFIQCTMREGDGSEPLSIRLKPAQKLDVATAILVPAEGVVPKLIVQREEGAPVIRYDLHGKVTPLSALTADATAPADAVGATARKEVAAADPGVYYRLGVFDARLDEVNYVNGPLLRRDRGAGKRYVTTIFTIKNRTNRPQRYVWSDFLPDLRDAEGEKAPYTQALLKATRDEVTYGDLAPGEEARIRFFFPLPGDVTGKTLRLAEGKQVDARVARIFAFDLTHAPASSASTR